MVKLAKGTSALFVLGKDTKLDLAMLVGDRVEIAATEENIKRLLRNIHCLRHPDVLR